MSLATGTVETPETPQAPRGHYWDRLAACATADDVRALIADLTAHGYSPEGQIQQAAQTKLADILAAEV